MQIIVFKCKVNICGFGGVTVPRLHFVTSSSADDDRRRPPFAKERQRPPARDRGHTPVRCTPEAMARHGAQPDGPGRGGWARIR